MSVFHASPPSLTSVLSCAQINRPTLNMKIQPNAGGLTNVGYELKQQFPDLKIGTMIAGNSGRPGGACGMPNGTVAKLHPYHVTQASLS